MDRRLYYYGSKNSNELLRLVRYEIRRGYSPSQKFLRKAGSGTSQTRELAKSRANFD